ncbi:MAG: TolB family protein [Bryobacteraceae bacterium]
MTMDGKLLYGLGEQNAHEAFTLDLDPASAVATGSPQLLSGPSGLAPESAAWSPDGLRIAFISGRNHTHGAGDLTLTVRTLASGQDAEWKLSAETQAVVGWSADGNEIYTSAQFGEHGLAGSRVELRSVSSTTGGSRTLAVIPGAGRFYSVAQSADDRSALLISYVVAPAVPGRSAQLIRKDLRTGEQAQLIAAGLVSEAVVSPDGKQVAALDRQANSAGILVKALEASEWKTLAKLEGTGYMFLNWLPNGDLMFGKEGLPNSAIYRLPAGGGAPQKVAELTSMEHVHEIRVNPNGRQLLFQSYVNHTEFWALENFLPKQMVAK